MIPNRHQQPSNAHNRSAACDELLQRAAKLIAEKKYQKAVDLLNAKGLRESSHQNLKGVCLMRLGLYDDAVRLFRSLVMVPGSTQIRHDAPALHKINFATSLLLSGCASGCTEVLTEIHQDQDPYVRQVRAAIDKWVSQMTILQKLNWWMGRIEPANRPVKIDFEPGDLGIEIQGEDTPKPESQPVALRP
ncbi:MAG: hypothetical protein KJ000_00540 [Pirellulaceae bacterium]|nr:hypothetical protein [Pirellulaceae bacterium]